MFHKFKNTSLLWPETHTKVSCKTVIRKKFENPLGKHSL